MPCLMPGHQRGERERSKRRQPSPLGRRGKALVRPVFHVGHGEPQGSHKRKKNAIKKRETCSMWVWAKRKAQVDLQGIYENWGGERNRLLYEAGSEPIREKGAEPTTGGGSGVRAPSEEGKKS